MKKVLFATVMIILCLSLAACGAAKEEDVVSTLPATDEAPEVTPEPTPEPIPVITVVTDTEEAEFFLQGADKVLAETEYEVIKTTLDGFTPGEPGAVVAYLTAENADVAKLQEAAAAGAQVVVFDAVGTNYVSDAVNFSYHSYGAQEMLLEEIMVYPLHDTPVRMFGMFTDTASEASALWAKYYDEGKIFPKGTYVENDSEEDAKTWLNGKLESFYPGMLDAIYVENEALAMAAAEVMESLGRDDAEIFVCNGSEAVLKKLQENHYLFGATVGANPAYAGAYSAAAAIKLLNGETVGSMEFAPHTIFAEDIQEGIDGFFTEEMMTEYPY